MVVCVLDDDSINVYVIVTINSANLTESGCGVAIRRRDIISHLKDFGIQ